MRILISNDDGYLSPGIRALQRTMSELGEATIVAPDRNRSGASNSITLSHPVLVQEHEAAIFSVQGTPADCVLIALSGLLDETADFVISGINDGPNMGDDVLYSGTVAAAMEGRHLGHPAIAMSMATHQPQHFDTAAKVAAKLVTHLSAHALPSDTILNVNVPDVPEDQLKGYKLTRSGSRHPSAGVIKQPSPRGETLFWLGAAGDINDNSEGTDFHAVQNNCVSITPLTVDLTHTESMQAVADWLEQIS